MEPAGEAERAETGRIDTLRSDSGSEQLASINVFKIDPRGPSRIVAELDRDFRTHFIAAAPDSRPDRGVQILGRSIPPRRHRVHGLLNDPGSRASPPRMHRRDGPAPFVDQQNRQAVRGLHAHDTSRRQ